MRTRRPRRPTLWLAALAALSVATVAIANTAAAEPKPKKLSGDLRHISNFPCASPTGVCSSFTATGVIKGEGVTFIDTFPTADGFSKEHVEIHTKNGELHCRGRRPSTSAVVTTPSSRSV